MVGVPRGVLAWRSANAVLEAEPQVVISGVDSFVNGTYSAVFREDMPPMFVRVTATGSHRWLYFDDEGRWRIAMQRQKDARNGGSAGFLRSCTVAPGTLPASTSDWDVSFCSPEGHPGWKACQNCEVCGAAHECDWPDLVLTLHVCPGLDSKILSLRCTNVGGTEIAHLEIELEKEHLIGVRIKLSERLQFPKKKIKLVLPDGTLLPEDLNSTLVADIFNPRTGSVLTPRGSPSCTAEDLLACGLGLGREA